MIVYVLITISVVLSVVLNRLVLNLIPKRKPPLTGTALYHWNQRRLGNSMTEGRQKKLIKNVMADSSHFIPIGTVSDPIRKVMKPAMMEQILISLINIQRITEERLQELEK